MYNINRRKFLGLFGCSCCSLILPSCSTVPITERKQLSIIPESKINQQAAAAYENFRKKTKLITSGSQLKEVREIGKRMENSVSAFFLNESKDDPTKNFGWDYVLVDNDKIVNAWCMPGGKIAVYSGLLKITKNTDALSIVMGHEIAHAVARHGSERASQGLILDLGTMAVEKLLIGRPLTGDSRKLYNYFTTFGVMLPFSRSHEAEADYLGLVFMHFAGYDLDESYKMWERMDKLNSGNRTPEFLSTHPSSKTRIENIKKWIPLVKENY